MNTNDHVEGKNHWGVSGPVIRGKEFRASVLSLLILSSIAFLHIKEI
jgi:hypothetical protein